MDSHKVKLRGIKISSTKKDSPNMIFMPEAFDQAENWLPFFTNPENKVRHFLSRYWKTETCT